MAWPRDAYVAAIWSSSLKPNQRLVALAYADHAGDQEHSWVTYPRLQERTGLSRDAIARAIKGLCDAGWLVVKETARQQKSTRYWLRIPDQPPVSQTAGYPQESVSRTADDTSPPPPGLLGGASSPSPDTSPLPPDTSSPGDGLDHPSHHSTHQSSGGEGDPALDANRAEAAASIVARFGGHFTEDEISTIVGKIDAWAGRRGEPVRDMVAFVAKRSREDLERWAGRAAQVPLAATAPPRRRRCGNGVLVSADGECCPACADQRKAATA